MIRILVIDPERGTRSSLKERLEYEGYKVEAAESAEEAIAKLKSLSFEVVLCEQRLPDSTGFDLLELCREAYQALSFIMVSANKSIDMAVKSIRCGAYDYIQKPIDLNKLLSSIRVSQLDKSKPLSAAASDSSETLPTEDEVISASQGKTFPCEEIVGESRAVVHLKSLIDKIAPSDARVLITGANGTGKELVARSIHCKSLRASGPFVEVNCAAIPSELIESELFGHEKGAFTSAIRQRRGKFEQAHGGTLFLDEIGDMSLSAQAKVLRVLQEHKICRVGSDRDIDVRVRVVAATNKNLREEIALRNFREDLYHRLGVIIIHIPSLKERIEDIPLLINHFIKKISQEYGVPPKAIEPQAISALMEQEWSGNIRELRNVVERLIILGGDVITLEDVQLYALLLTPHA